MSDVIEIFANGTQIERDFTPEEKAQREADRLEKEQKIKEEVEAKAKREAALAKLAALGLTTDDLSALGL